MELPQSSYDYNSADPMLDKDDNTQPSKNVFGVLAVLTFIILCFCVYNAYLLIKNGRLKRNVPLALFQVFSLVTLLVLMLYFLDFAFDYPVCPFNVFMTLPPYTYVCMGYSYMMNCVKVILRDTNHDKQGNPRRRKIRYAVYISVIFLILCFISMYMVAIVNKCNNVLSDSLMLMELSVMYYITFFFMMLMSYLQWKKIRSLSKTKQSQRRKHQLVTVAFGISYLVRSAFNTIQFIVGQEAIEEFKNYGGKQNIAWSVFLFFFNVLGELVPITVLLLYQHQSNLLWMKNKILAEWCHGESNTPKQGLMDNDDEIIQRSNSGIAITPKKNGIVNNDRDYEEEDSYYDEDAQPYCNAGGRLSKPNNNLRQTSEQDDNTSTAEQKHHNLKQKQTNEFMNTGIDNTRQNAENLRNYSSSQYSFEPFDDRKNSQLENNVTPGSGRFKQNEHSMLVTEVGTGLRVTMTNQLLHHQDSSVLAPSSAGNNIANVPQVDLYSDVSAQKSKEEFKTSPEQKNFNLPRQLGGSNAITEPMQNYEQQLATQRHVINTVSNESSYYLGNQSQIGRYDSAYSAHGLTRNQTIIAEGQNEDEGSQTQLRRHRGDSGEEGNLINNSGSIIIQNDAQ